jgi:hypothetical protein
MYIFVYIHIRLLYKSYTNQLYFDLIVRMCKQPDIDIKMVSGDRDSRFPEGFEFGQLRPG